MTNIVETKKWIWVTFQKAGFHRYPEAETNPNLKDVTYLASRHRHLFKFKVQIQVTHNNRDLEFHQVLNFCETLFQTKNIEIDYKSVEMLADDLYTHLSNAYPNRAMKIEVSEDGECGGLIEYYPEEH
jgi:hypothetical protein